MLKRLGYKENETADLRPERSCLLMRVVNTTSRWMHSMKASLGPVSAGSIASRTRWRLVKSAVSHATLSALPAKHSENEAGSICTRIKWWGRGILEARFFRPTYNHQTMQGAYYNRPFLSHAHPPNGKQRLGVKLLDTNPGDEELSITPLFVQSFAWLWVFVDGIMFIGTPCGKFAALPPRCPRSSGAPNQSHRARRARRAKGGGQAAAVPSGPPRPQPRFRIMPYIISKPLSITI